MQVIRQRGFTLVEMMIVVLIVAILAAVAVPAYRNQTIKSTRAVAKAKLLDIAARQEQYIADNKSYSNTLDAFTSLGDTEAGVDTKFNWVAKTSSTAVYRLTVTTASSNMAYTLTATPVNGQVADTSCGTLSLTNTGVRSASGAMGAACWD